MMVYLNTVDASVAVTLHRDILGDDDGYGS